jgi:hypothetical protein
LDLLDDAALDTGLSSLSLMEFWSVLERRGNADSFEAEWQRLRPIFGTPLPATEEIAIKAATLRRASSARLPAIDALIAATAAVHGTVLVHRDPHFRSIPGHLLQQRFLE